MGRHVGDHVGHDGARARVSVRRSAGDGRVAARAVARVRRRAGRAVRRSRRDAMADAIPSAQLVVIPDAGHSPQFENPDGVDRRAHRVPQRVARDRAVAPWRRTAVASRSRCCAQHDVDTMFTLSGGHLFVLYDGAVQNGDAAADRHAPRADRGVRRRRLGEGDAAARVRGDHGRAGRHQRRERDDRGVDERFAGGRARRARAAAAMGLGVVAGARSRPDRRVGHEARRDRDVGRVDRRRGRRRVPRPRPRRTAVPRSSTSRSTRSGPATSRFPRSTARGAVPSPTATRSRGSRSWSPARSGPVLVAGGDVYWADAETRDARVRRAGAHSHVRQRDGPRHAARRSRARVLARPVGRAEAGRPRARRGHAARLPARLRSLRRRAGRAPVRRRVADRGARRARRVDRRRSRRDVRRAGRVERAGDRPRRLGRGAPRRRAGEARRRGAAARGRQRADQARPDLRRAAQAARPRRDRHRRRRRLRVVRGQVRRQLRAGHVPRPRPVRLPRHGPRLRARGRHRAPRSPGRAAARRRRDRLRPRRLRVARAPRRERGGDRRQQRDLGPREAPDAGAVRLRRRGRAEPRASATTR